MTSGVTESLGNEALGSPSVSSIRTVRWSARSGAAVLGLVAGLATASVVAASPAGASAALAAKKHPTKHHGSQIPAVEHGATLTVEPVIRADKDKPPTKVLTRNLVNGSGAVVTATSTVTVKYVGANYTTGKDFTQATWQSGQATSFTLHQVVPGFSAGLVGMKVGGRREIVIPSKYGYQTASEGPIKPDETLVFVVDLESVST